MSICPRCTTKYPDSVTVCEVDGETLVPEDAPGAPEPDLAAGTMVGEFRVESKLGEGGFGAVYRAVHPVIGKAAAIKVLNREYSSKPEMVSRFIAEARAVNQIRHRNIVDIFLFGQLPDRRQFFVMELLDGEPLDQRLRARGRLSPDEALPLLRGVTRALAAAHAAGIIHRDLKPENIFLVDDGEGGSVAKLIDFGIAKLLGEAGGSSHKTQTGAMMGTSYFMSPEQCRGRNVDHRTDIYALGVVTHVMLTGTRPFDGESYMDVLMKQITDPPPRLSEVCPDLPPALDVPVLRMLAKKPEDRPAGAAEAFAELEAVIASERAARDSLRPSGPSRSSHVPAEQGALVEARTTTSDALAPGALAARSGPTSSAGTLEPSAQELQRTGAGSRGRLVRTLGFAVVAVLAAVTGAALVLRSPSPPENGATGPQAASSAPAAVPSARVEPPASTVEVAPAKLPSPDLADAAAPTTTSSASAKAPPKPSAAPVKGQPARGGNTADLDF